MWGAEKRRRIAHLVLACLVLQIGYWAIVKLWIQAPRPEVESLDIISAEVATLADGTPGSFETATFETTDLPYEECCERAGYRGVRMHFDLDSVPAEGLGLYPIVGSDNYRLTVNGSVIYAEGVLTQPGMTYHGGIRSVFRIPAGALKTGDNVVGLLLARDSATPEFFVAPPIIGDYRTLKEQFAPRLFWLNQWFTISLTVGCVVGLFALIVLLRSVSHNEVLWAFLLIASWTAKLFYYEWTTPPVSGEARIFALYALVNFIPVAWLNFANSANAGLRKPVAIASLGAYVALMLATAAIQSWSLWEGIDTIDRISMIFSAVLAFGSMGLFVHSVFRRNLGHVWQLAFFFLCLSLIVADSVGTLTDIPLGDNVNTSMPLLIVGFVCAFLAGNVRLFQSSAQLKATLASQLDERTAELRAAHQRERMFDREKAHQDERQRILRDMHDGLGSQLMSMLLAARRGEANPERVAEGLQSVVDEMRLMISSMDSVGESLSAALLLFRDRMRPRIEAAGFRFEWKDTFGEEFPDYGPRPTLQFFRILQEAVTNALKHSKGGMIEMSIAPQPGAPHLPRVTITDDGVASGGAMGSGRGLGNMANRAAAAGAGLDIAFGTGGVRVTLDLPATVMNADVGEDLRDGELSSLDKGVQAT